MALLLFISNIIGMGIGPQILGIGSDVVHERMGKESLRFTLLAMTPVFLWTAAHFYWTSKYLTVDIARASRVFR
jgi:hypothetical protein